LPLPGRSTLITAGSVFGEQVSPVCCNPNVVHVEFFGDGEPPRVWAEAE
jgi:hypothetical protein